MKVDIRHIRPNEVALRTKVDKTGAKYQEIVHSIPKVGILCPPTAIERTDEHGLKFYELVDGLHRYTAALECGLSEMPIHVVDDMDQTTMLTAQVIANLARVETKPIEFTNQIMRMLEANPTMTLNELAERTSFSLSFIQARMSLHKIKDATLVALVNEGRINLQNAYALSALPENEQIMLKDQAITEPSASFIKTVKQRIKELKEGKKTGAGPADVFPGANPHCRPIKDIKAALDSGDLDSLSGQEVLKWVLHLDDESVAIAKAEWEARKAKRDEAAQKRAEAALKKKSESAESLKKKAEEAAAELAKMINGGTVNSAEEAPAEEAPAEEAAE